MKQFSSDIRYIEATPRKQRKKNGAYSVISAGVSSSADNSALKSYVDSNFMSLATGQDVSALHNFLNGFTIAGIPFRKMNNGSLFIDANVVFGGGATMYGTDTTPAPSIFDGLPIDGRTIKRDGNGALYVDETALSISGGGGVADSVAWANVVGKPSWITNTKPTYNYSEIQGTPDLSVYALASAIPTNNDQLSNGAGYITASALNGYATQSWVNTALSGYFLTSNFTKANIKSTLGISDWALASAKPSYAWTEITSRPTNVSAFTNDSGYITSSLTGTFTTTDYIRTSKYIETGYLHLTSGIDNSFRTSVFGDAAGWGRIKALRTGGYATGNYGVLPGNYTTAMAFAMADTHAFIAIPSAASKASEVVVGGGNADKLNWSATLLHSLNYSDYALPITGGTVNGSITATGDLSANGMVRATAYLSTGFMQVSSNIDASVRTSIFGDADAGWGKIKAFRSGGSAVGSLAGAYASGILFAMSDTHGFIQLPSSAGRTGEATIGGGNGDKILWSAKLLHSLNFSDYALPITGGTIKGNLLTEGGITMYSQRSLKNILSYDGLSLEQLSVIKPIKFTWKDGRDNRYHVGGIADDVETVVPEVVYSANDFLTMDYGNAAFYVAASLIKPVVDHEQRIKILEQENKALRKEINQLKQAS